MKITNNFFLYFLLIGFLGLGGCTKKKENLPISFYFWQTTYKKNTPNPQDFLKKLNKNTNKNTNKNPTLFVRLFDVDFNPESGSAEPVGILQDDILKNISFLPKKTHIAPVVFITNQTMHALKKDDVAILANRIWKKVVFLVKDFTFSTFQIDCDWNESTKANFFHFLNTLQTLSNKQSIEISVTIRLHQIKFYKKTGIPPVKIGTLMAYNMGNVRALDTENSILDTKILPNYLAGLPNYPLTLDLALPLFSWIVVQRQGKVIKLLPQEDFNFKKHKFLKENFYEVTESQYVNGYYLYKNDILKLETTSKENLANVAEILQQYTPKNRFKKVVFYHFEKNILEKFDIKFLQDISSKF